ncbi:hypothetical protein SNE40_021024 [Patella caerulea]|uniref:Uncharacterized protein n=1 Tax=Patella caerulea TaxID=87958 RepID=A0AAN8G9A7_PATCE
MTNLTVHRQMHAAQRNVMNQLTEAAKTDYFRSKLSSASNQKGVFNVGDKLLFPKRQASLPAHSSADELANSFIKFFSDMILTIRHGLKSCPINLWVPCLYQPSIHNVTKLESFKSANEEEVKTVLLKSLKKSYSLDPCPT